MDCESTEALDGGAAILRRRTVAKWVAWTTPVVAAAAPAPAYAISPTGAIAGMCRLAATTISGNKIATEFRVGTYVPAGETYKAGNVMTANFSVTLPIGTPLPPYSDPVMSTTSEVMRTLTRGTVYQNAQSQWVIPYTFRYSRSADFSGGTSGECSAIVLAWTGASNNGSKMPVGSVLTLDPPARGSGSYVLNAAHTTYYP